jgi:hypothetical protein
MIFAMILGRIEVATLFKVLNSTKISEAGKRLAGRLRRRPRRKSLYTFSSK